MKNKVAIIAVLFIFCGYIRAFAEITVRAQVDKLSITADDAITYKLIITSTEKKIPEPNAPDFTGFAVVSQAQSSTFSFIKNGIRSILVYAYILVPQATGKFKIKPSRIKVRDKIISSQEFEIEVKPAKPGTKNIPEEKTIPLPETPSESEQPQVTL